MNFGFTEEQELLRKTARDFLEEHAAIQSVRAVMEDPEQSWDPALWERMAQLGWMGLALPEQHGGAGLSLVELCLVLEELGRCLAPVPFLPTVIAATAIDELGDATQRESWLPRIAAGEVAATFAVTEERGSDALADLELSARRDGADWVLRGRKLFVPDFAAANLVVVAARMAGGGAGLFVVPTATAGLSGEAMQSMDLLRPLSELVLDDVRVEASGLLGAAALCEEDFERVLDRARVMVAAEMVGGAEKCLEDSVAYAKERVQFGKPIGVNQAIKHKCADMLFQVESAKSITYYAAWSACAGEADAPLAASMAKSFVSDAYRSVTGDNIQIHGGVGFTWEYDCHLYFKRAKSDESWLGGGVEHRERVARLLDL
ncbi:MAG: acyl-CoA dehydrogenase family protein [Myxococcota bacterium]|nr:acyl-CoA dehydrogenase family protein [Myxococcota bacterium]